MLALMIVRAYATTKAGVKEADRMTDGPLFMVFPIMGVALLSSLLHLNNLKNIHRHEKTLSLGTGVISFLPSDTVADNIDDPLPDDLLEEFYKPL